MRLRFRGTVLFCGTSSEEDEGLCDPRPRARARSGEGSSKPKKWGWGERRGMDDGVTGVMGEMEELVEWEWEWE